MQFTCHTVDETRACGADIALRAREGAIFALIGGLGAGKTEWVRGFAAALQSDSPVRSPSFTLINTYETPSLLIHHFDFYRLKKSEELWGIGFDEYIQSNAVCLIEWADLFPEVLPQETVTIRFKESSETTRVLEVDDW